MTVRGLSSLCAVTVVALLLPAMASATWTHKGQGELKESASITLSGELSVSTEVGKVTCATSIGATLTGESSTGSVNSYAVSEPSGCDLTESLGAACGTHGATKVVKAGSWELTAKETTIEITGVDLEFQFKGCLIPSLRIKGTATATPDKTFAMSTLTLSGSQVLYNSLEEEVGSASLGGAPAVSPEATYGVKTAPLVKTAWLMGNTHLSKNGELTLNGEFSFSYSGGSISCTASAVLTLTAGEVEEEQPEGEVESFTVAEPSACVAGGALKTLCGEHPVKSVARTGTWALNATETLISVSGFTLDYSFEKCAITTLRLEGSATLTPESATAIKSATYGGKPVVYNGSEEELGTAELSGSPSASPSGTYAVKEHTIEPKGPLADEGQPVGEHTEIGLQGFTRFEFLGTGIRCLTHATLTTEDGSNETTVISEYRITAETCEGFGFQYSGCEVESDTADGLPWPVAIDEKSFTISTGTETRTLASCFTKTNEVTGGTVTATVDNPSAISSVTLSGGYNIDTDSETIPAVSRGTLEVTGEDAGTYGIEP